MLLATFDEKTISVSKAAEKKRNESVVTTFSSFLPFVQENVQCLNSLNILDI